MIELTNIEIQDISGAGVVTIVIRATRTICDTLIRAGLRAQEAGMGDMYLEAVRGGCMGA